MLTPNGAAETYLNADLELLQAARDGWLLPVMASYERALRAYPEFADAPRARANMALLFHALGFEPELERLSREKDRRAAPFAGVLLADLRREEEQRRDLAPLLDAGIKAGGVTACLAERVRSNLAADTAQRDAFPEAFASLAKVCPRTIVEDCGDRLAARARHDPRQAKGAAPRPACRHSRRSCRAASARCCWPTSRTAYDLAGNASAARAGRRKPRLR